MIYKVAKVKSVFFGLEDHRILTFSIGLDYGGTHQGFGGYALDTYDKEKKRRVGCAAGTDLILKLLNFFEVEQITDINGKYIYAVLDKDNICGSIIGLKQLEPDGNKELLIKDWKNEWFPDKKN